MLSPKTFLIFFVFVVPSPLFFNGFASGNPTRNEGNVSVELRDISKPLEEEGVVFNHPYFIAEDRLRTVLSSLRFREKGILKKRGGKRVFMDREVNAIAPLIVDSFSKADPRKEVFVSTTAEKKLVRDQSSTFSLFVLGKELNIAFSEVRAVKEESPSFKEWKTQTAQYPTSLKSHGFWELVPGEGQRLKEGHTNWLIIDVEDKVFEPVVAVVEEKVTSSSLIEERLRRLEERAGLSTGKDEQRGAVPEQSVSAGLPPKGASSGKTLGQKLRELKTLQSEELISPKDYEKKKLELLQEDPPQDKSVPDMLKELRGLKDEGLITEEDYEQWKIRLLKKL